MLRLGLHLGLRQKNLRQLMLCPKGYMPRSERVLEKMKRGEIRWSDREGGWEVFIPAVAFKNAHSSFFGAPASVSFPPLSVGSADVSEGPLALGSSAGLGLLPQPAVARLTRLVTKIGTISRCMLARSPGSGPSSRNDTRVA